MSFKDRNPNFGLLEKLRLAGDLLAISDDLYDIGRDGTNRPRDLWLSGDLHIGGVGPHSIGGSTAVDNRLRLLGDFTGSVNVRGVAVEGVLTIPTNGIAFGTQYANDFATAASGTHASIRQLSLNQPTVTANGASVTTTALVYLENAMTIGTNNYAIFVDGGISRFDGNGTHVFEIDADTTAPGAATGRIPFKDTSTGGTRYIMVSDS